MTVHEQPTQQIPSLGKPGEPCEECGAPLAMDQRYCLHCGHRRGPARVDYRSVMAAAGPASDSAQPRQPQAATPADEEPSQAGRSGERDFAPLAAVGGIAVLGLMLLVGVLIGKGNSTTASAPAPQVVRVPAAGGANEASGGGEAEAGGEASAGKAKKSAKGGGKSETTSKGLSGGGEGDDSVHEVSSGELEALESESGEEASKKSLELPNKIATEGEPPPIDKSKPPAGGEEGITIK